MNDTAEVLKAIGCFIFAMLVIVGFWVAVSFFIIAILELKLRYGL